MRYLSLAFKIFGTILAVGVLLALYNSCLHSPAPLPAQEQARLSDFQHLQRGDLLVDVDFDKQLVPVMLIIEADSKTVKVEFAAQTSVTTKMDTRILSRGKLLIIKRGTDYWCSLLERFYSK